jgi:histidinol-phosphatase
MRIDLEHALDVARRAVTAASRAALIHWERGVAVETKPDDSPVTAADRAPLDGTRGFARGGEFWGPLLALEHEGEVVVGACALPVSGRHYWAARGLGAFRDGTRLRVSDVSQWKQSTLSLGELRRMLGTAQGPGVSELIVTSASTRSFGDPAAPAMVLDGRAEAWLEAGVQVWDLAPFAVLLEEAGGRFTCWRGTRSIETGAAVGTNGRVHEHVLRALS